jgi:molecular chaperone HscB
LSNAFAVLGLEPRFDLDPSTLDARHRALSATLHPDRFAGAAASERRLALGKAIEVNEAHRALRDPVQRAECLLGARGVPVGDGVEPRPPAALLMEIMDVREELSAARRGKDLPALERLERAMRTKERATLSALTEGFAAAGEDVEKLAALLPELSKLRYYRRFFEELEATLDELSA